MDHGQDTFEIDRACDALETIARQQDSTSMALGAVEQGAHALHYLYGDHGRALSAYLTAWVAEASAHATDEQRAFLRQAGLVDVQAESARPGCRSRDEEDGWTPVNGLEGRPFAKVLPDLTRTVALLGSLAATYDPRSIERTCLELTSGALRFIVESGREADFSSYVHKSRQEDAGQGT